MSVSLCVTFVVFTDRESCTRPISTNSGSMEAGEYGLTRGTCFLACGLELDAVAGLLWISWCVLGGADFFSVFFSGRCSVTIFLTDLDGTVTQHDGNFLAVDGFPFFDGNIFGGRR